MADHSDFQVIFVLDNVRSSFNVGAIFRTADGVGASIHLIGMCPQPGKDNKLEKTSLSAISFVEWKYFPNHKAWLSGFMHNKQENVVLLSVEEHTDSNSLDLFDLEDTIAEKLKVNDKCFKIYIVFGHEINGVHTDLLSASDYVISIPMHGKKNSLNIATCVGIVGYRVLEIIHSKFL